MLIKEYNTLKNNTDVISDSLREIFLQLDHLLSLYTKNYSIIFKGKSFEFHPATTKKEDTLLRKKRRKFIKLLLDHCLKNLVKKVSLSKKNYESADQSQDVWNDVLVFTYGADPKDYECEKIIYEIIEGKEVIKSLPLNTESIYVQAENPNISADVLINKIEERLNKLQEGDHD